MMGLSTSTEPAEASPSVPRFRLRSLMFLIAGVAVFCGALVDPATRLIAFPTGRSRDHPERAQGMNAVCGIYSALDAGAGKRRAGRWGDEDRALGPRLRYRAGVGKRRAAR